MPLRKTYPKSKRNICRVTFSCPAMENADAVYLVGDFNGWDEQAIPMKRGKNAFTTTVELEPGGEYQFRYLINGQEWKNDHKADKYAPTPYADAQNSVVIV